LLAARTPRIALVAILTALAVLVPAAWLAAAPAGAGSHTQTNACAWPDENRRAVDITLEGTAGTDEPVAGEAIELTGTRVAGALPAWVAHEGYDWGIIVEGPNVLPVEVKVVIQASGTVEATQTLIGSTTLEFDYDPNGEGPVLAVDIELDDTTWTSQGGVTAFTQGRVDISGSVDSESLTFFRDCRPAEFNEVYDHTWVTPLPFELVGTAIEIPDVPYDHPFYADIAWLVETGIATGYADGTFQPAGVVTRQATAAFLYRFAGSPEGPFPDPGFTDVPTDHPFYEAIAWAADSGVASGYSDGSFQPGGVVSRQATAAFLHRLAGEPEVAGPSDFTDVPPGHAFHDAIVWMADEGITTGYPDDTFRPTGEITRQAMAAFLHRFSADFAG
jgi:hypothetical protein